MSFDECELVFIVRNSVDKIGNKMGKKNRQS